MSARVFLDACVLYPALVRALVLGAADRGLFQPLWSQRVLEEWRRAAAAKQGAEGEAAQEAATGRMAARWPDGVVALEPGTGTAFNLPDPNDEHVLAGAIAGGAGTLLTFNLRDFPARVLAAHGVEARHPDGFLWELLSTEPEAASATLGEALADFDIAPDRARAALKRARLSRLGKAWEAMAGGV